jgi:hypothetical protein
MLENQIRIFGEKLVKNGVDVKQMCFGSMHHVVPLFADTGQAEAQEALRCVKAFSVGEAYDYRVETHGTQATAATAAITTAVATTWAGTGAGAEVEQPMERGGVTDGGVVQAVGAQI